MSTNAMRVVSIVLNLVGMGLTAVRYFEGLDHVYLIVSIAMHLVALQFLYMALRIDRAERNRRDDDEGNDPADYWKHGESTLN